MIVLLWTCDACSAPPVRATSLELLRRGILFHIREGHPELKMHEGVEQAVDHALDEAFRKVEGPLTPFDRSFLEIAKVGW